MSRYLERANEWMRWVEERSEKAEDPRERAITRDFLSHLALEMSGDWQTVWGQMMVKEPLYHVYMPGLGIPTVTTYAGRDQVKGFYQQITQTMGVAHEYGSLETSYVATDWGLVSFFTGTLLLDGATLSALGYDIDDPKARYVVEVPVLNRWYYDEKAMLIGEDAHQIADALVTKLDPADDFTAEQRHAVLSQYFPK
jgi:hypothetical protein